MKHNRKELFDMARKTEEATGKTVETRQEKPERNNASGFYIYIGPNIKKYIQTGTVYRGTRAHALKQAAAAIEAYPLVKTLIVSGDTLPEARIKIKTPGNALYANYKKLAGKEGN